MTDAPVPALTSLVRRNTLTGGNNKLWGVDFTSKWAPNGDPAYTNFKLTAGCIAARRHPDLRMNTGPFTATSPAGTFRAYTSSTRTGGLGCATTS